MWKCKKCNEQMEFVSRVTNLHLTGDPKYFDLMECSNCHEYALKIHMEATVGSGKNYVEFRLDITKDEKEKIYKLMKQCPNPYDEECNCDVHDFLNKFESENAHRRKLLVDDYDIWG